MIPFNDRLFPEAMLFNLKAKQTVDSGLLRLKLQMKCELFSKLTYLLLFWVWLELDSLGLFFYSILEAQLIDLLKNRSIY